MMDSGDVDFKIDPTRRIYEDFGNLASKMAQSCPKCGYFAPLDEKRKELKDGVLIISALIISLLVLVIFFLLGGFK